MSGYLFGGDKNFKPVFVVGPGITTTVTVPAGKYINSLSIKAMDNDEVINVSDDVPGDNNIAANFTAYENEHDTIAVEFMYSEDTTFYFTGNAGRLEITVIYI